MLKTMNGKLATASPAPIQLPDLQAEAARGLRKPCKELPCKLFYDDQGSRLFEQICQLDEYYLTRTETAILDRHAGEIAALAGPGCLLVEYGSGSSKKTRLLLDHLPDLAAYAPIDISRDQLLSSAAGLAADYPALQVAPIWADYTLPVQLPAIEKAAARRMAFFPGSTIGNFYPHQARAFLRRTADLVGPGGGLLVGVDLKKDPQLLNRAYNDRLGVTAAFNLNLLDRLNRELGADFHLDHFRHYAFYEPTHGRIEMHLVSLADQTVHLDGERFSFRRHETILTEVSYKYDLGEFARLAAGAGFASHQAWVDDARLFSVHYLTARR